MNSIETEREIRDLALMLGETSLGFGHGACVESRGSTDEEPEVVVETYHIGSDGSFRVEGPKRNYVPEGYDFQI